MNNKQKTLKERIAEKGLADLEKAVDNMNGTKKRGRKPSIDTKLEDKANEALYEAGLITAAVRAEHLAKATKQVQNNRNAISIIEEEVGKNNLVRIAVRYLYNAIGGV